MSRLTLPVAFGLVCFVGFLIAAMPLRLAFDLALKPAGFEAGLVQGTVWNGHAFRVRGAGFSIAEAEARLAPASLLGGRARFDFALSDPAIRAEGVAALTPSGLSLTDTSAVARLDLVLPDLALVAPNESVQIELVELSLSGDGRCAQAEGRALTPALITLGERYGVALPLLRFDLMCAGDRLGVDISGTSDVVAISGRLIASDAGPEGRVEARTTERDVIAALSFVGFDQLDEDRYVLTLPLEPES
jgi:hypothetical protein